MSGKQERKEDVMPQEKKVEVTQAGIKTAERLQDLPAEIESINAANIAACVEDYRTNLINLLHTFMWGKPKNKGPRPLNHSPLDPSPINAQHSLYKKYKEKFETFKLNPNYLNDISYFLDTPDGRGTCDNYFTTLLNLKSCENHQHLEKMKKTIDDSLASPNPQGAQEAAFKRFLKNTFLHELENTLTYMDRSLQQYGFHVMANKEKTVHKYLLNILKTHSNPQLQLIAEKTRLQNEIFENNHDILEYKERQKEDIAKSENETQCRREAGEENLKSAGFTHGRDITAEDPNFKPTTTEDIQEKYRRYADSYQADINTAKKTIEAHEERIRVINQEIPSLKETSFQDLPNTLKFLDEVLSPEERDALLTDLRKKYDVEPYQKRHVENIKLTATQSTGQSQPTSTVSSSSSTTTSSSVPSKPAQQPRPDEDWELIEKEDIKDSSASHESKKAKPASHRGDKQEENSDNEIQIGPLVIQNGLDRLDSEHAGYPTSHESKKEKPKNQSSVFDSLANLFKKKTPASNSPSTPASQAGAKAGGDKAQKNPSAHQPRPDGGWRAAGRDLGVGSGPRKNKQGESASPQRSGGSLLLSSAQFSQLSAGRAQPRGNNISAGPGNSSAPSSQGGAKGKTQGTPSAQRTSRS
jgi:hypothetical protein